jgi:hypothetical protein
MAPRGILARNLDSNFLTSILFIFHPDFLQPNLQ